MGVSSNNCSEGHIARDSAGGEVVGAAAHAQLAMAVVACMGDPRVGGGGRRGVPTDLRVS